MHMADRAISLLLTLLAASTSVASQSLREAARLDEEGKCEEAERHYRALLAQGSPSGALLNNAGNHYVICGESDKAQGFFERILRSNPTHENANFQLARIAVDQRQGSKALEYLARVKREDPQILLVRAEALHWAGQKSASSVHPGWLRESCRAGCADALPARFVVRPAGDVRTRRSSFQPCPEPSTG